jgi:hypothetical protein
MEELARDPASRRRFLSGLGGAAAAGSFAMFLAACGSSQKEEITPGGSDKKTGAGTGTDRYGRGDLGIGIYALTLEYVAADFYAKAIESGKLSGPLLEMAKRFRGQEDQHIDALESFVTDNGGKLDVRPKTTFAFANQADFLKQAVTLENLSAGALLGQADRIVSKELLAGALSMHAVEGRHAAAVSVAAKVTPTPNGAFATPITAFNVIAALEPNLSTQ